MNAVFDYLKGFIALSLLLTVLNHMVPQKSFQKYVHFFSEMILAFGIVYPVLNLFGDSDFFLEKIHYEAFIEELNEVSMDAEKIQYMKNEVYVQEYEEAIALDVENLISQYDYETKQVMVELSDTYEIEQILVELKEQGKEDIAVGKVIVEDGEQTLAEELVCQELEEKIMSYYEIGKEQLRVGFD